MQNKYNQKSLYVWTLTLSHRRIFFMTNFVFRIVDLISGKQEKILFQSDKGQYKSGDTVKFRVMVLDQDLKVILADPDHFCISDPDTVLGSKWRGTIQQMST